MTDILLPMVFLIGGITIGVVLGWHAGADMSVHKHLSFGDKKDD